MHILTFSGSSKERLSVMIFPEMLNKRLEGQLVAQMHRYFLANTDRFGYENPLHQINGLEFAPSFGLLNSFLHCIFQSQPFVSRLSTVTYFQVLSFSLVGVQLHSSHHCPSLL